MSAKSELKKILAELKQKQVSAARRGDVLKWVQANHTRGTLYSHFSCHNKLYGEEWVIKTAQRMLENLAEKDSIFIIGLYWERLPYLRRILRAAGHKVPRLSLQWLRDRAEEE